MPPLKGIDRGLTGRALKALEESGHGRRIAVVDPSYSIPRWAKVIDYRGERSFDALVGVLKLVPIEGGVGIMLPDDAVLDTIDTTGPFGELLNIGVRNTIGNPDYTTHPRFDDEVGGPGFYSIAKNQAEDTLFIRTNDRSTYACATFIVGHMQVPAGSPEES